MLWEDMAKHFSLKLSCQVFSASFAQNDLHQQIALAVASSGIEQNMAELLEGGRTAHSQKVLKIPIPISASSGMSGNVAELLSISLQ